ncbi:J domain-containing protein [Geitlerinema sp. PCC 9228]|uniref:J domain-containing protein n=1 Tax=Geitlerinema sp. PCC 9228 TaxID=111611 RepID=UPI0009FCCEEE|nr:J domain-containing protein [Geitlerinema sp. PCC 9228]
MTLSFQIERGLFAFDVTDHHAILGIPMDASMGEVRKRYIKLARLLHPDSCKATTPEKQQRAMQLFSKLVNPAYNTLVSDSNYAEHKILLRTVSERTQQDSPQITWQWEPAQKLLSASQWENDYKQAIDELAGEQYQDVEAAVDTIAKLSELNLAYLIRQAQTTTSYPYQGTQSQAASSATGSQSSHSSAETASTSEPGSYADRYCTRAEELIASNSLDMAKKELQDAIKLDPNHAYSHALLGSVYLKQNQLTVAKVHINKALQLHPQQSKALEAKKKLDRLQGKSTGKSGSSKSSKPAKGKKGKSDGGLFGGLFGGKKK